MYVGRLFRNTLVRGAFPWGLHSIYGVFSEHTPQRFAERALRVVGRNDFWVFSEAAFLNLARGLLRMGRGGTCLLLIALGTALWAEDLGRDPSNRSAQAPTPSGLSPAHSGSSPEAATPSGPASAGASSNLAESSWPMERVDLVGGESRFGLIESVDEHWVHLVEIRRPPGRPGYLVVRPIERSAVVEMVRLEEGERELLRERIAAMVFHTRIENARMEAIPLEKRVQNSSSRFCYPGRWFQLEATTPEDITRRLIVRLEQVFAAYRQLLPPRTEPRRGLRIVIFSSMIEYEEAIRRYGMRLENPAFFVPKENLVLVGTDLGRFAAQLDQLQEQHARLRQELAQLREQLPKKLEELGRKLKRQGVPRQEAAKILLRERTTFESQITQKLNEIQRVERKNAELFSKIVQQTLRQLYHEAFHAYMENYLFPLAEYHTPPWLHEGLAMLFQEGILEADTLRIDAPSRDAITLLQQEIRKGQAMPIRQLLAAGPQDFLRPSGQTASEANRYYAYAWAVVYYLCQQGLLTPATLESYMSPSAQALSPIQRFERLVGTSIEEFEVAWQKYLRSL